MSSEYTKEMYPDIKPFDTGYLAVSDLHTLYYEESGQPTGKPVLFLHGGPGSGCSAFDRRYFDPEVYRIVLFDQRGAGKSTPAAEIKDNTTWHLVSDIEQLRRHLGVDSWVVFGGSWGSTLAVAYAETHPERVKALVLRGLFTFRREELVWLFQNGGNVIFPEEWERFIAPIPEDERHDIIKAYYSRLTSTDESVRMSFAKTWARWECSTARLLYDPEIVAKAGEDEWALKFAKIECHYMVNGGFFEPDTYLLDNSYKLKDIPTTIIQGRYDVLCPVETAWLLHKKLPGSSLHIVPDAGHSTREPGIKQALLEACELYKRL